MTNIEALMDEAGLVVSLGNAGVYVLHHGWESGTDTWIDGKIEFFGDAPALQLDVACVGEPSFDAEVIASALATWEKGSVHALAAENGGVLTLVAPGSTLTTTSVIAALRRFRP
jgi:hypothetical protein